MLRALDRVSFDIDAGEVLGVVGESGAGKSLTGAAIIGLLEPPGRIAGGEIVLDGQRIDNLHREAMRRIRGTQIGTIFQDPLTTLNPLYTIGRQLDRDDADASARCQRRRRPQARDRLARARSASPPRRSASTPIRTSSPAACASAW